MVKKFIAVALVTLESLAAKAKVDDIQDPELKAMGRQIEELVPAAIRNGESASCVESLKEAVARRIAMLEALDKDKDPARKERILELWRKNGRATTSAERSPAADESSRAERLQACLDSASDPERLQKLISGMSAAELKSIASAVSSNILGAVTICDDWNHRHDKINFAAILDLARRCDDEALTASLFSMVADCVARVKAECQDEKKNALRTMHSGSWYTWNEEDESKARKIIESWKSVASDAAVLKAAELTVARGLAGGKYLAVGRPDDIARAAARIQTEALRKELAALKAKTAECKGLADEVGRGMLLSKYLSGKAELTTELQVRRAFDGLPICFSSRVCDVDECGQSVVALLTVINVLPDYSAGKINLLEVNIKATATDAANKDIAAQWNRYDKVQVRGVFHYTPQSKSVLGTLEMTGVVDAKEFDALQSTISQIDTVQTTLTSWTQTP